MALGIIEPKTSEQPPGTEYLVDTSSASRTHEYEHTHLKHGSGKKREIVLIPQPSDDPNDPLLWPTWKRELAFVIIFFNSIIFAACPGPMIAPATVALAAQLDVPVKRVAELSGYQLLVVGALGPLVSVLAEKYGKRPQFLFASLFGSIGTAICISSFSTPTPSYTTLLAGRLVQGLGTTAYESLAVAALGDMFYLHARGLRTSLLVLTTACLASFVAICAGHMFETMGARALFVVLLPLQLLGFVGALVGVPEMQFRREEAGGSLEDGVRSADVEGSEKSTAVRSEEHARGEDGVRGEEHAHGRGGPAVLPPSPPAKRTFIQDLRLTSGTYTSTPLPTLLARILLHLLNPAILFITLVASVLISFFVGTAYVLAQIFTPPPYRLSVAQNGYFFTGALVGGLLGILSGPACDWVARRMARRNGGVHEAEFRIPILGVAVVLLGIGWFVFAWALEEGINNVGVKGVVVLCSACYGLVCAGTSVAGTGTGLYILDAFRPFATDIFILQMMIKNFLFYAFSTFINDFAAEKGPAHMCRTWGIITICGFTTCIPMYLFGKLNRALVHRYYARYLSPKQDRGSST